MLPRKEEKRTFSNGPLRDQWEKRAQSVADQQKEEAEWKKKSSLKLWDYLLLEKNVATAAIFSFF